MLDALATAIAKFLVGSRLLVCIQRLCGLLGHLDVAEVLHPRQDSFTAAPGNAASRSSQLSPSEGLGDVDIPFVDVGSFPVFVSALRALDTMVPPVSWEWKNSSSSTTFAGVVADEHDLDALVVPLQKEVQEDEEALGEVLAVSSIEPETSMMQNITACAIGTAG